MAKDTKGGRGFAGGEVPTGLGPGQDGFDGIKAFESTYVKEPGGHTVEVGREETIPSTGGNSNKG